MRTAISNTWSKYILLLLLVLSGVSVRGQGFDFAGRDISNSVTGRQLKAYGYPYHLSVQNDAWLQMQSVSNFFTKIKYKSNYTYAKFSVTPGTKGPSHPYIYKVVYDVVGFSNPSDTTSQRLTRLADTLIIAFNPDSLTGYQNVNINTYEGLYYARIKIDSIYRYDPQTLQLVTTPFPASDLDTNFRIELGMKYQPFVLSHYPPQNTSLRIISRSFDDQQSVFKLVWSASQMPYIGSVTPCNYDLEWTFVDDYAAIGGTSIPPSQLDFDFKNNATRITTSDTQFAIPVIYPRGYLLYRIRMVRPDKDNYITPVYGEWNPVASSGAVSAADPQYLFYNQHPYCGDSLNWKYTISFAEAGKYKHVVQFGDGMGKERQTITRFNSNLNSIVATESIYDYEGRSAINVLPAAAYNTPFRYLPGFANYAANVPYSAQHFDFKVTTICPKELPTAPFDGSSLVNKYYSPNNIHQTGFQKYVPDAEGYPFARIIAEPGGRAKPLKVGGVGKMLQIDSAATNIATYDYVGAEQTDLNRILGINSGRQSFYTKTVMTDPNGQASMEVKDYEGKTVITSLVADGVEKNTHAMMSNVEIPAKDSIYEEKLANAVALRSGHDIMHNGNFYMDEATDVQTKYVYSFKPFMVCEDPYIGLSVKASYDYNIIDPCGILKLHKQGVLGVTGYVTSPSTVRSPANDTSVNLAKGKHTYDKKLTIATSDIYAAVDSFFTASPSCLKTKNQFIREEVSRRKFPCTDNSIYGDNENPCEKLKKELMAELFPNEKYGKYTYVNGKVVGLTPAHENKSIFDRVINTQTGDSIYRYQTNCVKTALQQIVIWRNGVKYSHLDRVAVDTFIELFVPGPDGDKIAEALLTLHPEYCRWLNCYNDTFGRQLKAIPNAMVAQSLGLYDMNEILITDPFISRMVNVPNWADLRDSLTYFNHSPERIDRMAAEQALCRSDIHSLTADCRQLFKAQIQALQFPNSMAEDDYFKLMRDLYLANRDKYLKKLWALPTPNCYVGDASCGLLPIALIPAPVIKVFYDQNGGLNQDSATSPFGFISHLDTAANGGAFSLAAGASGGSSGQYDSTMADSLIRISSAYIGHMDSVLSNVAIDTMLSRLANCNFTPTQTSAFRTYLLGLMSSGQVRQGEYTPAQVRAAMDHSGIIPGDLCHPYLISYGYYPLDTASQSRCKSKAWYQDVRDFLNQTSVSQLLRSQAFPTAVQPLLLATNNLFERELSARLQNANTITCIADWDSSLKKYDLRLIHNNDTVILALHAAVRNAGPLPVFANSTSLSFDSLQCFSERPAGRVEGSMRQYVFSAHAVFNNASGGFGLPIIGWNNAIGMSEDEASPLSSLIPYTQIRTLYQRFRDTMGTYNVQGADHPFWNRSLGNFMDFELRKTFSTSDYNDFIQSAALADSAKIPLYGGYGRITGNSAITSLLTAAANNAIPVVPLLSYRSSTTAQQTLFIDYRQVPFGKVKQLNDLVQSNGGTVNQIAGPTTVGWLIMPKGLNPEQVIEPALLTSGVPQLIDLEQGGIWLPDYALYTITCPTGTAPHILSRELAEINSRLSSAGIYGHFLPSFFSTVNGDYYKPQKQAFLRYTYAQQSQTLSRVLDTLREEKLRQNLSVFANDEATYTNPANPGRKTDLFYTNAASRLPAYPLLQRVFAAAQSYYGSTGQIFQPIGMDSVKLISGNHPDEQLILYRCQGGLYWYRYFEDVTSKLYNVYVKVPAYLYRFQHPNLRLVSMRPKVGDTLSRSFTLSMVLLGNNPQDTFRLELDGYTDFDLATGGKLEDVLLGNKQTAGAQALAGNPELMPNCEQTVLKQAVYAGEINHYNYIKNKRDTLRSEFYAHVMGQLHEELWLSYADRRFGMTVYGYDRAGNKMFTVPPMGIKKLPATLSGRVDFARAVDSSALNDSLVPGYEKVSTYAYNTANQLLRKITPDAGQTDYFYDRKGNLVASQSDAQGFRGTATYFLYDGQNRLRETGEVVATLCPPVSNIPSDPAYRALCLTDRVIRAHIPVPNPQPISGSPYFLLVPRIVDFALYSPSQLDSFVSSRDRKDVVVTTWDVPFSDLTKTDTTRYRLSPQRNLRARIGAITVYPAIRAYGSYDNKYSHATHFSYDAAGNVAGLVQDFPELEFYSQRYKRVDYDYDLHSGKVNLVSYNRGHRDQFYHRYGYDADNRLRLVETSREGLLWTRDAEYKYYDHGPLARMTLGEQNVQGVDYAYTLQGWLKSINGSGLGDTTTDMGRDGGKSAYAADAYAMALDYFAGDYKAIGQTPGNAIRASRLTEVTKSLYNGNIARMTNDIRSFGALTNNYTYDQLNRLRTNLTEKDSSGILVSTKGAWNSNYVYDQDGNLTHLRRNAGAPVGGSWTMDSLTYFYDRLTQSNRLLNVTDSSNYALAGVEDIAPFRNATTSGGGLLQRYFYEADGQLIKDLSNGIDTLRWNVYGKLMQVMKKSEGIHMSYGYDGNGQRVRAFWEGKAAATGKRQGRTEYYVRDAGGNILAVLEKKQDYNEMFAGPQEHVMAGVRLVGRDLYIKEVFLPMFEAQGGIRARAVTMGGGSTLDVPMAVSDHLLMKPEAIKEAVLPVGENAKAPQWLAPLLNWIEEKDTAILGDAVLGYWQALSWQLAAPTPQIADVGGGSAGAYLAQFLLQTDDENAQKRQTAVLLSQMPLLVEKVVSEYLGIARTDWQNAGRAQQESWTGDFIRQNGLEFGKDYLDAIATQGRLHGNEDPTDYSAELRSWLGSALGVEGLRYQEGEEEPGEDFWARSNQYLMPLAQDALIWGLHHYKDTVAPAVVKSGIRGFLTYADHGLDGVDGILDLLGGSHREVAYDRDPVAYLSALCDIEGEATTFSALMEAIEKEGGHLDVGRHLELMKRAAPQVDLQGEYAQVLDRTAIGLQEHVLYGSARLGVSRYWPGQLGGVYHHQTGLRDTARLLGRQPWYSGALGARQSPSLADADGSVPVFSAGGMSTAVGILGQRGYELCDHLGNVHAVVSDKRGVDSATGVYKPALSAAYDYYPFGMLLPGRHGRDTTAGVGVVSLQQLSTQVQQSEAIADLSLGWSYCGYVQLRSSGSGSWAGFTPLWYSGCSAYGRPGPGFKGHIYRVLPSAGGQPMAVRIGAGGVAAVHFWEQVGGVWQRVPNVRMSASGADEVYSFTPATNAVTLGLEAFGQGNLNNTYSFEEILLSKVVVTRWVTANAPMLVRSGAESKDNYRFGFNGQEKVNEIAGGGNHLAFDARGYDSRLGRFWATDPLEQKFPGQSTYSFAGNNPILMIDKEGKIKTVYNVVLNEATGKTLISRTTSAGLMRVAQSNKSFYGSVSFNWHDYSVMNTTILHKDGKISRSSSGPQLGAYKTNTFLPYESLAKAKISDGVATKEKGSPRDGIILTTSEKLMPGNDNYLNREGRGQFVNIDDLTKVFNAASAASGAAKPESFFGMAKHLLDGYSIASDVTNIGGQNPNPGAAVRDVDTTCTGCGSKDGSVEHGFDKVITDKKTGDTVGTIPAR